MKKMKGFRKDLVLTRTRQLRKNGASDNALMAFLTQRGFNRRDAGRVVDGLNI